MLDAQTLRRVQAMPLANPMPLANSERGGVLVFLLGFVFVLGAAWVLSVFLARDNTVQLTSADLEKNASLWETQGITTYDLVLQKRADRLGDELYNVSVVDSKIAKWTMNGKDLPPTTADAYTIPGLFEMSRRELELSTSDAVQGARKKALLKVDFDPKTGLPTRFKAIAQEGRSFVIDIEKVTKPDGSVIYSKE